MNSVATSEKLQKDLSRVRSKKILKLRDKIAAGSYRVDNVKLAKALFLAR